MDDRLLPQVGVEGLYSPEDIAQVANRFSKAIELGKNYMRLGGEYESLVGTPRVETASAEDMESDINFLKTKFPKYSGDWDSLVSQFPDIADSAVTDFDEGVLIEDELLIYKAWVELQEDKARDQVRKAYIKKTQQAYNFMRERATGRRIETNYDMREMQKSLLEANVAKEFNQFIIELGKKKYSTVPRTLEKNRQQQELWDDLKRVIAKYALKIMGHLDRSVLSAQGPEKEQAIAHVTQIIKAMEVAVNGFGTKDYPNIGFAADMVRLIKSYVSDPTFDLNTFLSMQLDFEYQTNDPFKASREQLAQGEMNSRWKDRITSEDPVEEEAA